MTRRAGVGFAVLGVLAVSLAPAPPLPSGPPSRPATPPPSGAALPDSAAAWWARGRFVALERDGGIEVHDISGARPALPLPGKPAGPARWSPARDAFAIELALDGMTDVWLVELGSGEPHLHRLTFAGGAAPRWIAGGRRLIYEAPVRGGGVGLFIRDEDGLGAERGFWDDAPAERPAPALSVQA